MFSDSQFGGWVDRKYSILQQHANADTTRGGADVLRAEGDNARSTAEAELARAQASDYSTPSNLAHGTSRVPMPGDRQLSPKELAMLHAQLMQMKAGAMGGGQPMAPQAAPQGLQAAGGANRVPGKGSGNVDTVPAVLAPGEAVLNKHAAELIGRDKIAAANAIGVAHQKSQGMVGGGKPGHFAGGTADVPSSYPLDQTGTWKYGASGPSGALTTDAWPMPRQTSANTPPSGGSQPTPKPQRFAGGTHKVGHGKSAKTPSKIDPQALMGLLGAMQGGQQMGGGQPMPQQAPGGMV